MDSSSGALIKGVIDLGTNTFNLVIAEVINNQVSILFETKIPVLIGQSVFTDGKIDENSWNRGLETIDYFKTKCIQLNCNKIIGVGTASFRKASNGSQFLLEVKSKFDIDVEVISGVREAEYIFWGARQCYEFNEPSLLIDGLAECNSEYKIQKHYRQ